ncbi:MAG: hypothetical protein HFJ18_00525 [Clostridia bacterium]|nr:hypothetical protein [Clostridia bacterium]
MARYQYETSPRKIRTDYEPVKKKTVKKKMTTKTNTSKRSNKKLKTLKKIKIVLFVLIGFLAFFTISFRNAMIDSKYAEIKKLKNDLALVEKENEQLQAGIESHLNLKTIQEEAETQLGMKALSNDQIKYVNLPKTDYIEAGSEQIQIEEDSYFTKVINFIKSLIK